MSKAERLKAYWADVHAGRRPAPQRNPDGTTRRKVRCVSNWARSGELIVTIYPHGELGFREPKHRDEYRLSMTEAFRQAVILTTLRIGNRVKQLKKEGMTLGKARRQARREILTK